MPVSKCLKKLVLVAFASAAISPSLAIESPTSKVEPTASQAANHLSPKTIENTIGATEKAGAKPPSNWAEHATISYALWCQGNIYQAINEGEKAAELNPTNAISVINLALMKQNSNAYGEAISLYQRSAELEPENWVPALGIARCYIMSGNLSKGRKALKTISEQDGRSFDWYYMAAKTWFGIADMNMTEKCATKAIGLATKQEQRAAADNLLLLVLLREDKLDNAKSLQEQVFKNDNPREPELYVRAVLALLPIDYQAGATTLKVLLDSALRNFNNEKDADALFKLGRAFEIKAADPKCDAASRTSWLESAQAMYIRAIALNPKSADYHFAAAGIFSNQKRWANAVEELTKTLAIDRHDLLCPYLIAKLQGSGTTGTAHSIPLNLSLVQFNIEGLTCACKLCRIQVALRTFNNVAFLSTPPQKPFVGLILVDQSQMSAKELLAQCKQNAFPAEAISKDPLLKVKFEIISDEPVTSIDSALQIAKDVRFAPSLNFEQTFSEYSNRFKEVFPINPTSDSNVTSTASSWNAPL